MKKLFVYLIVFLMMLASTFAISLTRDTTPSSVSSSGEAITLKYTITGISGDYGGIIYETIPAGWTIDSNSFSNNFDVFGKKVTGQLVEMAIAGTSNNQYVQFDIISGSSSGKLYDGYVEWAIGGQSDLPDTCIKVAGAECTGGSSGESSDSSDSSMIWIIAAVAAIAIIFVFNKK